MKYLSSWLLRDYSTCHEFWLFFKMLKVLAGDFYLNPDLFLIMSTWAIKTRCSCAEISCNFYFIIFYLIKAKERRNSVFLWHIDLEKTDRLCAHLNQLNAKLWMVDRFYASGPSVKMLKFHRPQYDAKFCVIWLHCSFNYFCVLQHFLSTRDIFTRSRGSFNTYH